MKLRCERDVLTEVLATAGRAAANRGGALPVLSGVRMELNGDELTVTGSDLDLTVSTTALVSGISDGVAVLPSRLMSDIVKALTPGSVELEVGDDEARITAGPSEFSLRPLRVDEFPKIAEAEGTEVRFELEELVVALKQVLPAASSDENRPILTGVLMTPHEDGVRLVATDSYRLAVRDLPGVSVLSGGAEPIVPSRALGELVRAMAKGEATMRLGQSDATFESAEGITLTTRLIEGSFPSYERLFPANQPNALTVGREALLEAIRRVKLLARDGTPVRLVMNDEGLQLRAVTQDIGEGTENVEATFSGTELTVAFNPDYLLAGVEAAAGDSIVIETTDSLKPAVVTDPESAGFRYLLMPVRVQ